MYILSLNVNGLREQSKIENIFAYIKENYVNIALLQETFWDDLLMPQISKKWKGQILYSNDGNERRRGVAILVNENFIGNVNIIEQDTNGRYLHVHVEHDNTEFELINIYAPNSTKEKGTFFNYVNNKIPKDKAIILAGDFNTIFLPMDIAKNMVYNEDKSRTCLENICKCNNLVDLWRHRNPDKLEFTRRQIVNNTIKQSRIDYYFISRSLLCSVNNVFIKHLTLSDHEPMFLQMNLANIERGQGVWIFNNMLLKDNDFCNELTKLIEQEKQNQFKKTEISIWWDNLKFKIKKLALQYAKKRNKNVNDEITLLTKSIEREYTKLSKQANQDITHLEVLENQLSVIQKEKCQGAVLRSKADWALEGERNTSYFLKLEKHRQRSNTVYELEDSNGCCVKDTTSILNTVYKFYSDLYKYEQIDANSMHDILSYVNVYLDEPASDLCDTKISLDELTKTVKGMSNNKSPGIDGLTVEFYKYFWNVIGPILNELFCEIHTKEVLTNSMRKGILTPVYKETGDKKNLKNWRPISLLNVDYKVISRCMASRLSQVIREIVSENQTCCIPGRDISDTISTMRDLMYMIESEGGDCIVLKLDQEKAFDRVSHEYLVNVMNKMRFGPYFTKWISIFYKDIISSVKCNGHLTPFFKVMRSVRQGCPISALLYVLVAEPLSAAIKQNENIKGIPISGSDKVSLIYQHADDTTLTLADKMSIEHVFSVFDMYGKASGAKINVEKSELLTLEKQKTTHFNINMPVKRLDGAIQILGVYIGQNLELCENMNWKKLLSKIKNICNMWKQRDLTLQGRIIVINCLLISRILYILNVQTIPLWAEREMKAIFMQFLWREQAHFVAYDTLVGDISQGGLKLQDISIKKNALRAKVVKKLFDPNTSEIAKALITYIFKRCYDMQLSWQILLLNHKKSMMKNIPQFYQEVLTAWHQLLPHVIVRDDKATIMEQPLFHNPQLLDELKGYNDFIKSGITQLKDICYEVIPGFLRQSSIVEIIQGTNPNALRDIICECYETIKHSIPTTWKKYVYTNERYQKLNIDYDCPFYVLEKTHLMPISCCSTATLSKYFIEARFKKPSSIQFWKNLFPELEMTFWKIALMNIKPPECKALDYKIFHNGIFTMKKLYNIGKVDSNVCHICQIEEEDIMHLFVNCIELSMFHKEIKCLIELLYRQGNITNINYVQYDQLFLLGEKRTLKNVNVLFINLLLSIARFAVYRRRNVKVFKNCTLHVLTTFQYLLQCNIKYQMHYYKRQNKMSHFKKKITTNNPLVSITDDMKLTFHLCNTKNETSLASGHI